MKNKNGWGLTVEIMFLMIFLLCLFIAIIGIKKFGLFGGKETTVEIKIDSSIIEKKLVNAGKKYVNERYDNIIDEEMLILRVSHLKKNKYINTLKDNNGASCSGYVEVYKDSASNIMYLPYIKCKSYTTEGYDSRKDW